MAHPATAGHPADHFRVPVPPRGIREQPLGDFITRTERSAGRTMLRAAYPGLQAPAVDLTMVIDALPAALNRPRKLSNSSVASSSGVSRESFESRPSLESRTRGSSWSSRTSFESIESNPWRPEYLYHRPAPIKRPRQKYPGEIFAVLPGEVLELILDELKKLHLGPGSESCATCWMRDLCSICLSARKWCKFARTALYVVPYSRCAPVEREDC